MGNYNSRFVFKDFSVRCASHFVYVDLSFDGLDYHYRHMAFDRCDGSIWIDMAGQRGVILFYRSSDLCDEKARSLAENFWF